MTPIPICHLRFSDVVGGVETHLAVLLRALDPARYTPHVITFPNPAFEEILTQRGISHERLARGGKWDFGFVRRLRGRLRGLGVRLVHTHGLFEDLYTSLACRLWPGRPRHVLTKHTFADADAGASARKVRTIDRLDRRVIYGRVDAIVAVSEERRQGLIARHRVDPRRLTVIRNGIEIDTGAGPPEASADLHALLGLSPETPLFGFVGRLNREKGPDIFIEVLGRVAAVRPEVAGVVMGDGPMRAELEGRACDLGLSGRLHWLGHRRDAATLLGGLTAVVMPSRTEGLPMLLLEAMAQARPIVASEVGGVPEVIERGRTGWLCRTEDVEGFTETLLRLLDHPAAARLVARSGWQAAAERFSAAGAAEQMMALYDAVLGVRR